MPYLAASELIALLPVSIGTITGSSRPLTIGEVGSIIARVSADLDGAAAGAGYAVPVSSEATVAFAQMQLYTEQGAGYQVLRRIYSGSGERMPLAADYKSAYETVMKSLRGGKTALIDVGAAGGEGGRELPRSYLTSNVGSPALATPAIDFSTVF